MFVYIYIFLNFGSDMHRPSPCFHKSFQTDALFWGERSGNLPRSCMYFLSLIDFYRRKSKILRIKKVVLQIFTSERKVV